MDDSSSHAELGRWTEGLFEWVLWIFQAPDAGLYAGALIVAFGVVVTILVWISSSRRYLSVCLADRALGKYSDRDGFTENFDTISNVLLSNTQLKRAWYEFVETLIFPPDNHVFTEPRYKVIQNTRRPHEYFNLHVIPDLKIKPLIAPSTFVALGLLLTFIGLVAALTAAASAFTTDGNDGAAIEQAINNLLIVAGAKFFASIGGLISSLLVSLSAGLWQNRINTATSNLCDNLEKRTWFISQTQVASDQYAHAIRQTDRLEELKDQLAVSIGEQFQMALSEVPGKLAGVMGDQLTPIAAAIEGMASNMGESFANAAGSMSDELRSDTEATIRSMVAELKDAAGVLSDTSSQLRKLSVGFDESIETLNGAAGQLYQATNSVNPLLQSMQKVRAELQDSKKVIESNIQSSKSAIESLESLWKTQGEQLKFSDDQLASAFSQVERMTQASVDHLQQQLTRMDSSVASIASSLNNSQAQLTEAVGDLDDTVVKLSSFGSR